jgi:hypothetical protein
MRSDWSCDFPHSLVPVVRCGVCVWGGRCWDPLAGVRLLPLAVAKLWSLLVVAGRCLCGLAIVHIYVSRSQVFVQVISAAYLPSYHCSSLPSASTFTFASLPWLSVMGTTPLHWARPVSLGQTAGACCCLCKMHCVYAETQESDLRFAESQR